MEESDIYRKNLDDPTNVKDTVPNGIQTSSHIVPSIIHQTPDGIRSGDGDFHQLVYNVPAERDNSNYKSPYPQLGEPSAPPQVPNPAERLDENTSAASEVDSENLHVDPELKNQVEVLVEMPKEGSKDSLDRIMMPPPPPPFASGSKRPASPATPRPVKKSKGKGKAKGDDVFDDADALLEDPRSPLYQDNLNLKAILQHPKAKSALSSNGEYAFENVSSEELTTAAAAFQEDGRSGRHDPEWVRQAMAASSRRQAGDFDVHNSQKFQDIWAEDNEELSDADYEDENDEDDDMDIDAPRDVHYGHNLRDPRNDNDDDHAPGASGTDQSHAAGGFSGWTYSADASGHGDAGHSQPANAPPSDQNEFSNQIENHADFPPPPRCQIIDVTSDAKIEHLFRMSPFLDEPTLKVGDVFRAEINGIAKTAKVTAWFGLPPHNEGVRTTWSQGGRAHLEIAIPPGNHATSEPLLRADIAFPNSSFSGYITGPVQIYDAMRYAMNPEKYAKGTWANWDQLEVHRNGELLGSLYDIRQAHHFAQDEFDFHCQLKFTPGRQRRVHKSQQAEGYQSIDSSGLYRKILKRDFHLHNHDLFLDLGDELNDTLAACADDPAMVVMCDLRMLNNDGITTPKNSTLETVYSQGPQAFPTCFTRELASAYGWSKGHAHVGPIGLGKGHSTSQWSRGRGKGASTSKKAGNVQDRDNWLDYCAVKEESTPKGCVWTKVEITKVKNFHSTYIARKIQHFPFPRTMSMRSTPASLSAQQLSDQAVPAIQHAPPIPIARNTNVGYHVAHYPSAAGEENLGQSSWKIPVSIPQSSDQAGYLPHNHMPVDQSVITHQQFQAMADYSPQSQYPQQDQFLPQSQMPVEQRAIVNQRYDAMVDPFPQSQFLGDARLLHQAHIPLNKRNIAHHANYTTESLSLDHVEPVPQAQAPVNQYLTPRSAIVRPFLWSGSYHYEGNPDIVAYKLWYERNFHLLDRSASRVSPNAHSQALRQVPQLSHVSMSLEGSEPVIIQYQDVKIAPQPEVQATVQNDLENPTDGVRMCNFEAPETPGFAKGKRPRRSFDEIGDRPYKCGWRGCEKAYDTLGHLNTHVKNESHGPHRSHGDTSMEFAPVPSPASYKYKCRWNDCNRAFPELRKLNGHIEKTGHGPLRTSIEFPRLMDRDDPNSLYPEVPINESTYGYNPNASRSFGMSTDLSPSQLLDPALFLPSSSLDFNAPTSFIMRNVNQNHQLGAREPFLRSPYHEFGLDGCDDEPAERRGSADSGYCSQSPLPLSSSADKNPETQIPLLEKKGGNKSTNYKHNRLKLKKGKNGSASIRSRLIPAGDGRSCGPSSLPSSPTAPLLESSSPPPLFPANSGVLDPDSSISSIPTVSNEVYSRRVVKDLTLPTALKNGSQAYSPSTSSSLAVKSPQSLSTVDQLNMSRNLDTALKSSGKPDTFMYLASTQVKQDHRVSYIRDDRSPSANSSRSYPRTSASSTRPSFKSSSSMPFHTPDLPDSHDSHNNPDLLLVFFNLFSS